MNKIQIKGEAEKYLLAHCLKNRTCIFLRNVEKLIWPFTKED